MVEETQKHFKHEVPKEPHVSESRINLTFRYVKHRRTEIRAPIGELRPKC